MFIIKIFLCNVFWGFFCCFSFSFFVCVCVFWFIWFAKLVWWTYYFLMQTISASSQKIKNITNCMHSEFKPEFQSEFCSLGVVLFGGLAWDVHINIPCETSLLTTWILGSLFLLLSAGRLCVHCSALFCLKKGSSGLGKQAIVSYCRGRPLCLFNLYELQTNCFTSKRRDFRAWKLKWRNMCCVSIQYCVLKSHRLG